MDEQLEESGKVATCFNDAFLKCGKAKMRLTGKDFPVTVSLEITGEEAGNKCEVIVKTLQLGKQVSEKTCQLDMVPFAFAQPGDFISSDLCMEVGDTVQFDECTEFQMDVKTYCLTKPTQEICEERADYTPKISGTECAWNYEESACKVKENINWDKAEECK